MDEENSVEITQEERELIIETLRDRDLEDCEMSEILFGEDYCNRASCSNCGKAIKNKLIALIESAPAKKNMKAIEFADKLEKAVDHIGTLYGGIAECLGYDGSKMFGHEDVKRLCDAIRNLDASEPFYGRPWPLGKDGIPIKPGDTVYFGQGKFTVDYIGYSATDSFVHMADAGFSFSPYVLYHKKSRTLDDIKGEIYGLTYEDDAERVDKLIDEIFEMGKKAVKEEQ